jgi:hypothetical protein
MALKGLYRILFQTNVNSPFINGDIVTIFVETSTNAFTVKKNGTTITSGPTLGVDYYIQYWRVGPPQTIINYSFAKTDDLGNANPSQPDLQYCSGSDLIRFDKQTAFPYVTQIRDANSPSCSVSVCDIHFTGQPTIIRPSTSISSDGSIQLEAVSSAGSVRYSLSKYDTFASMANASGLFSSLYPGTYTIYAKDIRGCGAEVSIELVRADNYHVKWRLAYTDLNGWGTRVDIQELDYTGSIIEVIGGSDPFTLSLRGENKNLFDQVLSTEAIINLLSETNFQFISLFTQNDRQFKVIYYKNTGSGFLARWSGWMTPSLYGEEYYSSTNYEISANATDNLTTLSNIKFSETNLKGRQPVIFIIAAILKKLNLGLDICVACDVYENSFYTSPGQQFQNTGFTSTMDPWFNVLPPLDTIPLASFTYSSDSITANDGSSHRTQWTVQSPLLPQEVWPAGSYTFRITGTNHSTAGTDVAKASVLIAAFDETITVSNQIGTTGTVQFDADNTEHTIDVSFVLSRDYKYLGISFGNARTPEAINFTVNSISMLTVDTSFSPFYQTYIDVDNTYYDDEGVSNTCEEVIADVLKVFAARIYQWNNVWNIDCLYMKSAAYTYHKFNADGNYYSGTFTRDQIFDFKKSTLTNRAVWTNTTQNLEIIGAIGKSNVTFKLKKYPFGLLNGGFEDYTPPTSIPGAIQAYDGWTLVKNENVASYAYISNTSSGDALQGNNSDTKMLINSDSSNTTYSEDAYIYSKQQKITFSAADAITFSFDFKATERTLSGDNQASFVKCKWRFKLGSYYLLGDGTWTTNLNLIWNEVVVATSDFNKWNTIEVTAQCPAVLSTTSDYYDVKIMTGSFNPQRNNGAWEFHTTAAIQAIPTTLLPEGYVICYVGDTSSTSYPIRWYKLTVDSTGDITPTDYNASTNKVVWKLDSELFVVKNVRTAPTSFPKPVSVDSFDNVTVKFLPYAQEPPDEKLYTSPNNSSFKDTVDVETLVGDAPPDITNSSNIYKNILMHYDGTPTYGWSRAGFSEFMPLLSLLAKQIVEHYRKPKFKLTGTFTTDTFIGFDATLRDGSRVFLPMGMTIKDKMNEYSVEIHEFETVDENTTNPFGTAEFYTPEFGQDFDI